MPDEPSDHTLTQYEPPREALPDTAVRPPPAAREPDTGTISESQYAARIADRPTATRPPSAVPDAPSADGGSHRPDTLGASPSVASASASLSDPRTICLDFPGYVVEGELGRGGMGVVFKVWQLALNRPAALKMVLGGKFADPITRARFLIEAEAVAQLRHPHVVQVYEFGRHEDQPYFVMEYVAGGCLTDRLKQHGRMAPRPAAELVAKLADAIATAHARGIVHRDLKPANVLLTAEGEPKITDFGLAKVGESDLTESGAVLGTPSFMAPEQAAGRTKEVGTGADIYSLGAILYDLLTGRPPFKGDTVAATIQQVIGQEPTRPRSHVPGVPRDLETVCLKCLQKDARRRYPTADALATDLRAYLAGRPIAARPVGPVERTVKWVKRNPGRTGVFATSFLTLVGVVIAANEMDKRRERDQRAARAETLVQALAAADTPGVGRVTDSLKEFRDISGPLLAPLAAEPVEMKPGLHARLALAPDDPAKAAELAAYLPACRSDELLAIRDALAPHAAALAPPLWALLEDRDADGGRRLRAACGLAGLTPADGRWPAVAPSVAERLVRENPTDAVVWGKALLPVGKSLLPPLIALYPELRRRIETGKLDVSNLAAAATAFDLTAGLLAKYAADDPAALAELATAVDARHHALLAGPLAAHRADTQKRLANHAARGHDEAVGLDPDQRATSRANAFAALVHGGGEPDWSLLGQTDDPTFRAALVRRVAAVDVDPLVLARRYAAADPAARRLLVLALGEYDPKRFGSREWDSFGSQLLRDFQTLPDPGLHAALDWFLTRTRGGTPGRHAHLAKLYPALDALPAAVGGWAAGARDWFVNAEGQTFSVVRGPVVSRLGSPPGEKYRTAADGPVHAVKIGRSFAVGSREVSLAEFRRFRPGHAPNPTYSPSTDCAVLEVSWYDAAAYCNWLSAKDGLPQEQWCYEPNAYGQYAAGMKARSGHLALHGYRLPTEAEWEYAARAGSTDPWSCGLAEELLPKYAWFGKNADDHAHPVGSLMPNELGLFDTMGNAFEWTADPPAAPGDDARTADREWPALLEINERTHRVIKGGAFANAPAGLRTAYRSSLPPGQRVGSLGFRVARTVLSFEGGTMTVSVAGR